MAIRWNLSMPVWAPSSRNTLLFLCRPIWRSRSTRDFAIACWPRWTWNGSIGSNNNNGDWTINGFICIISTIGVPAASSIENSNNSGRIWFVKIPPLSRLIWNWNSAVSIAIRWMPSSLKKHRSTFTLPTPLFLLLLSSNTGMRFRSLVLDSNTKMTTEERDLLACLPPVTTDTVNVNAPDEEDYEIRTLRAPNLARLSILPMYPTADEPSMQHLLLSNVPSKIFHARRTVVLLFVLCC